MGAPSWVTMAIRHPLEPSSWLFTKPATRAMMSGANPGSLLTMAASSWKMMAGSSWSWSRMVGAMVLGIVVTE